MNNVNRRYFLLGSMAASLPRAAVAQTAPDTIAAGFIGTGNRGSYLLRAASNLPGLKVAALCDLKSDRLDKAATFAAKDSPATFSDYHKLLEKKDVQAVFIATPCDLHAEMAVAALQAGKNVYCEKPLGINPDQVRRVVRAAKASKNVFQIGQQMRSESRLRQTIDKIHEGTYGKIIMVKAQRHSGEDLDHNGPSADWFFNASRSGDVIVEMAVHNLDECNWVIDSHPERAAGFGGTLLWKNEPPGRTNMDGYTLSYEYANGVKLSFTQVFFHPNGMPGNGQTAYVYTTEGGVDLGTATYYPRARGAKPTVLVERAERRERGAGDPHIAAFLESIRTGAKPPAGIAEAATAALTSIMGRDAIYKKKVVTWQEMNVEL